MDYYSTNEYPQSLDVKVSAVMKNVYLKMFLGLLLTAAVAYGVAAMSSTQGFLQMLMTNSWIYWGLAILEIGLVMWISAGLR